MFLLYNTKSPDVFKILLQSFLRSDDMLLYDKKNIVRFLRQDPGWERSVVFHDIIETSEMEILRTRVQPKQLSADDEHFYKDWFIIS